MIGSEGTDNCHKFVDILGLRTIFPLFMKTPKKMKKTGTSEKEHEGQYLKWHFQWDNGKSLGCIWVWFVGMSCYPLPTGGPNRLLLSVYTIHPVVIDFPVCSLEPFLSLWEKLGGAYGNQTGTKDSLCGSLLFTSFPTVYPECGTPPISLSILIKLVSSAAAFKPCREEQIACLCVLPQLGNRWINLSHRQAEGEECAR